MKNVLIIINLLTVTIQRIWKNDKINVKGQYEFVNGARCEGNFFEELNGDGSFILNGNKYSVSVKVRKGMALAFLF